MYTPALQHTCATVARGRHPLPIVVPFRRFPSTQRECLTSLDHVPKFVTDSPEYARHAMLISELDA
jgi:hypothetical protein